MKLTRDVIVLLVLVLIVGCAKELVEPTIEEPTPAVQEEVVEENIVEVNLTVDKIMEPDNLDIKKGTAVRWYNKDSEQFYHNVVIYSAEVAIPDPKDIIVQSGNINPGEYWEYVFEESGKYVVKDIYSGTMKGEITANAVADFLETNKVIGRIRVS